MGLLRRGQGVCGDRPAGFLEPVDGWVVPGGDEVFFRLCWGVSRLEGGREGRGAEGREGGKEGGRDTFFGLTKPTWPVAMPAFLCRFVQGV